MSEGVGVVPCVVRGQDRGKGVWGVCMMGTVGTGQKLETLSSEGTPERQTDGQI